MTPSALTPSLRPLVDADAPIYVTAHALRRFNQRTTNTNDAYQVVHGDVRYALRAGRVSTRLPAWCRNPRATGARPKPSGGEGIARYVWTEAEDRAYVLSWRRPARHEGRAWVVVTMLGRDK